MAYYIVYGVITAIGAFFVYYFVLGDRLDLAQEITKISITLGFFVVLLIINYTKNSQRSKRMRGEIISDEEIAYVNSKMKWLDKIVSASLGLVVLFFALYDGSFALVDIIQALLAVAIHYSWHYYLFLSRTMVSYSTISALTYLDKTRDYAVLLIIPIIILLLSIFSRDFSGVDVLQALAVFIIAYTWHRYLFILKR